MKMLAWKPWIFIVVAGGFLSMAYYLISELASGRLSLAGCNGSGYSDDAFLAYCGKESFGDYEHGAYYFGLEWDATRAMAAAQVIFAGSSRTQFAFSTRAVEQFFQKRSVPYYLLGFGYEERNRFYVDLARKYHLRPKVLVINQDPFFTGTQSVPAMEVTGRNMAVLNRYLIKKALQFWHERHCREVVPGSTTECGKASTLYRSRRTGAWIWQDVVGVPDEAGIPAVTVDEDRPYDMEAYVLEARRFLKEVRMEPSCVVITSVPSGKLWRRPGPEAEFARRMGFTLIDPEPVNITTIDGSHLTADAAERWSSAVLAELDAVVRRCTGVGG